jgi:hypothetical protein
MKPLLFVFAVCGMLSCSDTEPAVLTLKLFDPVSRSKVFLICDSDWVFLQTLIPEGYHELMLCDGDTLVIDSILAGIDTSFVAGAVLDYTFQRNGRSHIFVHVPDGCGGITEYADVITAAEKYKLDNQHIIGECSVSLIFKNQLK